MARTKAFDPEIALSKAMEVFWQKGYTATSVHDLVTAMGINRGSLYDTFIDKRHLFLQAIAHYHDTVVTAAIAHLQAPCAARAEIEQHFLDLATRASADRQQRGCLMTNTVVELAGQDAEVASLLKQSMLRVEEAFYRALMRAQAQGEISSDKDIWALAQYFTSSLQGLRVMAKAGADATTLQSLVRLILQALETS